MSGQFNVFEEGQFSDVEDDDFQTNHVQTGRGEKREHESDMSQKPRTDKAKTNKDNITINWRAEGNTIRKNSE